MFRVRNTILADEIATAKFACDVNRCKGACCVVGDAGAPVAENEVPELRKAYDKLKYELRPRAREVVDEEGLVKDHAGRKELNCTDGRECVFVTYNEQGVAECAIQKAYFEGRLDWEKPLSCHLFPVRLKRIAGFDYASLEYLDGFCAGGCQRGEREGTYLSEFLEKALKRRYGKHWYDDFVDACETERKKHQQYEEKLQ